MSEGFQQVANKFNRPDSVLRNNKLQLTQSQWFINGEAVNATAAQLNSAGSGGGISSIQVSLPMVGFVNLTQSYCFAPDLTVPAPFGYVWTSSTYPPSNTSAYSFIATGTELLGQQILNMQVGVYQFYVSFVQNLDFGIFDIILTGPGGFTDTQTIDMYNDTQQYNAFFWTETITAAGVYTVSIVSNNKNILSTNYKIQVGEMVACLIS